MYNTNSKRKSMIFWKKNFFFEIFDFFSKGETLWCQNCQKRFFPFFKNFKNKPQKWLSWNHSNINRNKVMNFGGCSSYAVAKVWHFMVIRAIMAPPPCEIGLKVIQNPWPVCFYTFFGKNANISIFLKLFNPVHTLPDMLHPVQFGGTPCLFSVVITEASLK